MGKVVVSIARLVTIHMMTIRRVVRVVLAHTAIKFFNLWMFRAKSARREPIRPPEVCLVLVAATIVPRVNIQKMKGTENRLNAKPVLLDSFKICPDTPRAANAQVDGETP